MFCALSKTIGVEAVGADVTGVTVDDRVAALTVGGSYAEYVYFNADRLVHVPAD